MADTMLSEEAVIDPEPSSSAALVDRRIEFHLARKTYNGFSNNSSFGFKLVTLNPNSEHDMVSELAVKREMPRLSDNLVLNPELSLGLPSAESDEEYDRGKRKKKKIRGPKISFDEPNLFQETAKQKRAKLHRSNSGNQPFTRI